ncbi:hypothetical protein ACYRFT_12845 [Listeria kieliensis]
MEKVECVAYAIQNIRTKQFVQGTDFNYSPRRQRLTNETPMLFSEFQKKIGLMKIEIERRGINPKTYRVVKVKITVEEDD